MPRPFLCTALELSTCFVLVKELRLKETLLTSRNLVAQLRGLLAKPPAGRGHFSEEEQLAAASMLSKLERADSKVLEGLITEKGGARKIGEDCFRLE
jgi:hypothetical protein